MAAAAVIATRTRARAEKISIIADRGARRTMAAAADSNRNSSNVLYRPEYDIFGFGGRFFAWLIGMLHPFDIRRSSRIAVELSRTRFHAVEEPLSVERIAELCECSEESLQLLYELALPERAARVAEVALLHMLPSGAIERALLTPLRWQCAGTLRAVELARRRGWAVNLGGGMHHAAACGRAEGFCFYPDVTLAVRVARRQLGMPRCMIIDLDAHQGNGHENDRVADLTSLQPDDVQRAQQTFIVDVYNGDLTYPRDKYALTGIGVQRKLTRNPNATQTNDRTTVYCYNEYDYLGAVQSALDEAQMSFERPDLIVYVAGTDVLAGDPLGGLNVSQRGVVDRDEKVFRFARNNGARIVMLLAGGYTHAAADAVIASLRNLSAHRLIELHG